MAQPNGAATIHAGLLAGFGDFAPTADIQIFVPVTCAQSLAPGTAGQDLSGFWQKPKGCRFVQVSVQGAGGGGGSGRKGSTITVSCGGGGGAGGNFSGGSFLADDLPDEMPLYVPAGQAGGAAISANDTNGIGVNGGTSTKPTMFGSPPVAFTTSATLIAQSGAPGSGGFASSGTGGAAVANGFTQQGTAGASASTTGAAGSSGTNSAVATTGGGAGGGLTSGNLHSAGGPGGGLLYGMLGGAAGGHNGNPGQAGGNGATPLLAWTLGSYNTVGSPFNLPGNAFIGSGAGGGGGGSANSGDAFSGGNGGNGFWGGGGGGGGAATDTSSPQSGAGGNGGDGYIMVVSW